MCPDCRTLVQRRESHCPSCGASMSAVPSGGIGRLIAHLLPGRGTVTVFLITANVALSLLILMLWGTGTGGGLMGILSPPWYALYLFGSNYHEAVLHGEIWRLITSNYLHGGLLHLLFNCYALSVLGPLVEQSFGARKYFLIYATTGVCAMFVSAEIRQQGSSVGASGALFGLFGFAITYGYFRGGRSGRFVAEQLMRSLVYSAVMLFMPGIDNLAHLGGLVAGAGLGLVIPAGEPRSRLGDLALRLATWTAVLATLGAFLAAGLHYGANVEMLRQAGVLRP